MKQTQTIKVTPQKHISNSNKKKTIDEALAKDLVSPFYDTFPTSVFTTFTPLRKQPQYLLSPSPIKRDLFSQLLGTQTKHHSPLKYDNESIMEEQSQSFSDLQFSQSCSIQAQQEELLSDNEGIWSDQNGIKKRKRKSTAQIKLLKQELDGEMNWTKQKIVRMAQVTGLSQSQVYKWCWDQKKKHVKVKQESQKCYLNRRKFIKKDLNYRHKYNKYEQDDEYSCDQEKQNEINYEMQTKLKSGYKVEENMDTERKVKKRLIFS